jgi:2'-5' RNA ligase
MNNIIMNWYKLAKKGVSYSFSFVGVNLSKKIADSIIAWGKDKIKDEDLYTEEKGMGRENQIHITVKYGLHTAVAKKVRDLIENEKPVKASLGKIGLFKQDDYDVVIIKVDSPELKKLNKLISDNLTVTDTFPIYKPHCTVAYVKKGMCNELKDNTDFEGKEMTFDSVVFSAKDTKENTIIKLQG